MTTAVEYKKYKDLLSALAQFVKNNVNVDGIDSFLRGYAGNEWTAEKEKAGLPSFRANALDIIYSNGDYEFFKSDDDRWIVARSGITGTYRLLDDYWHVLKKMGPDIYPEIYKEFESYQVIFQKFEDYRI